MPREDLIPVDGKITAALGGGQYEVTTNEGKTLRGQLCGQMKKNKIRVLPGDSITLSVSPYDMTHGIITRRFR